MKPFTRLAALALFALAPAVAAAGRPSQPAAAATGAEPAAQSPHSIAAAPAKAPTIRFDKAPPAPSDKAAGSSLAPVGAAANAAAGSGGAASARPSAPAAPRQADLARPPVREQARRPEAARHRPHAAKERTAAERGDLARPFHPIRERSHHPVPVHPRRYAAKGRKAAKAARSDRLSPLDRLMDRLVRDSHAVRPQRGGPPSPAESAPPAGIAQPRSYRAAGESARPAPAWQGRAAMPRPLEESGSSGPEGAAAAEGPPRPLSWRERGFPPGPPVPRDETVIEGRLPPFPIPPPPPPR